MLLCGTRITAEYSAPFERVFLSFLNKRAEPFCTPTGGAVAIGHLHSFTFLELLPSLTLLSGGSTDALLS